MSLKYRKYSRAKGFFALALLAGSLACVVIAAVGVARSPETEHGVRGLVWVATFITAAMGWLIVADFVVWSRLARAARCPVCGYLLTRGPAAKYHIVCEWCDREYMLQRHVCGPETQA